MKELLELKTKKLEEINSLRQSQLSEALDHNTFLYDEYKDKIKQLESDIKSIDVSIKETEILMNNNFMMGL